MAFIKSPQQQIFDACFSVSDIKLGYDTYTFLPAKGTDYPFVYIGEQFSDDRETKSVIFGNVVQTIHIYDTYRNRRTVTDMINAIKKELRKLKHTETFYVKIKKMSSRVIPENSTAENLLHGVIEVEFQFN